VAELVVSGQLEEGAPEVRPREEALPRSRYPRLDSHQKFFLKAPVSQAVGLERAQQYSEKTCERDS
jgi:hypothetical protein